MQQYDVFLSYAAADRAWAAKLADALSSRGLTCFAMGYSERDTWRDQLESALESSRALVVLWSPAARESRTVDTELSGFLRIRSRVDVVSVALDGTAPSKWPARASLPQRVYAVGPAALEKDVWEQLVEQIVASVRGTASVVASPASSSVDAAVLISAAPDLPSGQQFFESAKRFAEWLTAPDGGRLAADVVRELLDPSREDIEQVLSGLRKHRGGRLFLYAAGLGARERSAAGEPGVLVHDSRESSRLIAMHLASYAAWFHEHGAFDEVVLFEDLVYERLQTPQFVGPWRSPVPPNKPIGSRFIASALTVPDGAGWFTTTLLDGLRGRAAGPDGTITTTTLAAFVTDEAHRQKRDVPTISSRNRPIVLSTVVTAGETAQEVRPGTSNERVNAHADDPAMVDSLGRRPFAEVIGARIEEVRFGGNDKSAAAGAFMVNLHGPWGAGKTSVLNFLRSYLQRQDLPDDRRWVVVEFNAWRHQRLQPPWWNLISDIYGQAKKQLHWPRRWWLRTRWTWWTARADLLPSVLATVFVLLTVWATQWIIATLQEGGLAEGLDLGLGIALAILSASAAAVAASRTLVFGSAKAAQAYMDVRSDPLSPIIRLFRSIVHTIRRPVVVFIDDLDRCDRGYVIDLLEGIQTLFRGAPVTYVVAADRKWICSCFEKRYEDFGKTIGEPGRPLGYLFLDKVFQVSASVPRLSSDVQREFWVTLLKAAGTSGAQQAEDIQQAAERDAAEAVKDARTVEELQAKIDEAGNEPVREQAMRAAAAKRITSPAAQQATEHRLHAFADLLEANPRAMKRLVNTFGLYQAAHFLERRAVPVGALARWTILELRWPLLADYLTERPQAVRQRGGGSTDKTTPRALRGLLDSDAVRDVLSARVGDESALTEAAIREIVGLSPAGSGEPGVPPNAVATL